MDDQTAGGVGGRRLRRRLIIVVSAVAVIALGVAVTAAVTQPHHARAAQSPRTTARTHGPDAAAARETTVNVINLTDAAVYARDWTSRGGWATDRRPENWIAAAGTDFYTPKSNYTSDNTGVDMTANYRLHNGDIVRVYASNGAFSGNKVECGVTPSSSPYTCSATVSGATRSSADFTIRYKNTATHVIGKEQTQRQHDLVKALCVDSNRAACSFTPSLREDKIPGKQQVASDMWPNCGQRTREDTIAVSHTVGGSTSLGLQVSAGVSFFNAVSVSITGTYQRTWNWSTQRSSTHLIKGPARTVSWFGYAPLLQRVTGLIVIKLDNQTWRLTDVTFEAQDVRADGAPDGALVTHTRDMSAQDEERYCRVR